MYLPNGNISKQVTLSTAVMKTCIAVGAGVFLLCDTKYLWRAHQAGLQLMGGLLFHIYI